MTCAGKALLVFRAERIWQEKDDFSPAFQRVEEPDGERKLKGVESFPGMRGSPTTQPPMCPEDGHTDQSQTHLLPFLWGGGVSVGSITVSLCFWFSTKNSFQQMGK